MHIKKIALIKSTTSSFAFQRAAVAALVLSANLLAAKLLGPQQYGEVAMFIFLAKTLVVFNLGSVGGFMLSHYGAMEATESNKGHMAAYAVHLMLFGLIAVGLGIFLGKVYWAASLGFILLIPLYAIEPMCRIQRKFYMSLLPDILLSFSASSAALIIAMLALTTTPLRDHVPVLMLALMAFAYLVFPVQTLRTASKLQDSVRHIDWGEYRKIVRVGFPQYLATLAFIGFLTVDRFFLERFHHSDAMGVYMLAYQLSTGAGLLLTAQSFVSGIDIGESMRDGSNLDVIYWRLLKVALMLALPSYIGMLVTAYILETYFLRSFSGLTWVAAYLGLGFVAFQISANVTGLAFYMRKQERLTVGMFVVIPLAITANILIIAAGLDGRWVGFASGISLIGYAIFALTYTHSICLSHRKL